MLSKRAQKIKEAPVKISQINQKIIQFPDKFPQKEDKNPTIPFKKKAPNKLKKSNSTRYEKGKNKFQINSKIPNKSQIYHKKTLSQKYPRFFRNTNKSLKDIMPTSYTEINMNNSNINIHPLIINTLSSINSNEDAPSLQHIYSNPTGVHRTLSSFGTYNLDLSSFNNHIPICDFNFKRQKIFTIDNILEKNKCEYPLNSDFNREESQRALNSSKEREIKFTPLKVQKNSRGIFTKFEEKKEKDRGIKENKYHISFDFWKRKVKNYF